VNILGSLFYGTMLGVFLTAFFLKFIRGTAVFWAAVMSETVVIALFLFERSGVLTVAWLWYPVIGCMVVLTGAVLIQLALGVRTNPGAQE